MRKFVLSAALVLVFAIPAHAVDVWVYRDDAGVVRVASSTDEPAFTVRLCEPYFAWEGTSSRLDVSRSEDYVRLQWAIDERGPSWIFITLTAYDDGRVAAEARHSANPASLLARSASSWSAFASQRDDLTLAVEGALVRSGQMPTLPTPAEVRRLVFGDCEPTSPMTAIAIQCAVAALDSPDWKQREAAATLLSSPAFLPHVKRLADADELGTLSPSQQCRLRVIRSAGPPDVPASVFRVVCEVAWAN